MDKYHKSVILKKINRTAVNLAKNNMEFHYAATKEDVPELVGSFLKDGDIIANGSSATLKECGVIDLVKSHNYKYLDREQYPQDEIEQLYRASFSSDVYLTGANAITEDGLLYNVDGNSNRIAAIAYGPKTVVVVAGFNKIVHDLDEAVKRVKSSAAPINCERLTSATDCHSTGICSSLVQGVAGMCDGCDSDERICCNYLISAYQRKKNRIKVIIVGEVLGY